MSDEQNISVVMVSYHTGAVLPIAVRAVLAQAGLAELIIVDNGNPIEQVNGLREMAESEPRLKVITGQGNVGFAKGCNLGAAEATGEFVLLLNPDAILPEGGLAGLREAVASHEREAVACAKLLNADASEQRGGRRELLTPSNALAEAGCLYKFLPNAERLNHHEEEAPTEITEVPAISGSCMMMRKSTYTRLEGMDEEYFLHMEDMDFCYRAATQGVVMLCVPSVELVHIGQTSASASWQVERHKVKSFVRYVNKHFASSHSKPVLWLLQGLAYLRYAGVVAWKTVQWFLPECSKIMAARRLLLLHRLVQTPQEQDMEGKHYLLTGATNQVGLYTMGNLLARGAKVTAVQHSTVVPFWHQNLTWVKGDLARGMLNLGGEQPDALVHAAELWLLPPVMHVLSNAGIKRLIAFGSTSVFTKVYSSNAEEKKVVDDLEQSEIQAVEFCRKYGVKWTIFRPTMIYGAGLDANVTRVADFIRRFGFFMLYPPAKGRRQPSHAEDLAIAALQAMDKPSTHNKAYNLSGGEVLEYRAMIERIFIAMGKESKLLMLTFLPTVLDFAGKILKRKGMNGEMARRMNQDLTFPYGDARRDFDYAPRAFLSGGAQDLGRF